MPFTSDNQLMEFRNNIDQRQQVEKLEMKGLILFLDMYMYVNDIYLIMEMSAGWEFRVN